VKLFLEKNKRGIYLCSDDSLLLINLIFTLLITARERDL
jgi:hypothetical protein